jgi:hypothetical protein
MIAKITKLSDWGVILSVAAFQAERRISLY